jgi:integrase
VSPLAEWGEFNLADKVWTIPAARMKMRRPHKVPLSKQALALLEELRSLSGASTLLFAGVRSEDRATSDNRLNAALRRLGYGNTQMTAHAFRDGEYAPQRKRQVASRCD